MEPFSAKHGQAFAVHFHPYHPLRSQAGAQPEVESVHEMVIQLSLELETIPGLEKDVALLATSEMFSPEILIAEAACAC